MEEMPCNTTLVPAGPNRAGPPDCGRVGRTSRMEFEEDAEPSSRPCTGPTPHPQGIMQAAAGVIRILGYYSTMGIPGSSLDS